MNELIELIIYTESQNVNGFPIKEKHSFPVYAKIGSVRRQEFYAATQSGIKVDLSALINTDDWNNTYIQHEGRKCRPTAIVFDGVEYNIFRSFVKSDAVTELTLQEVD